MGISGYPPMLTTSNHPPGKQDLNHVLWGDDGGENHPVRRPAISLEGGWHCKIALDVQDMFVECHVVFCWTNSCRINLCMVYLPAWMIDFHDTQIKSADFSESTNLPNLRRDERGRSLDILSMHSLDRSPWAMCVFLLRFFWFQQLETYTSMS